MQKMFIVLKYCPYIPYLYEVQVYPTSCEDLEPVLFRDSNTMFKKLVQSVASFLLLFLLENNPFREKAVK